MSMEMWLSGLKHLSVASFRACHFVICLPIWLVCFFCFLTQLEIITAIKRLFNWLKTTKQLSIATVQYFLLQKPPRLRPRGVKYGGGTSWRDVPVQKVYSSKVWHVMFAAQKWDWHKNKGRLPWINFWFMWFQVLPWWQVSPLQAWVQLKSWSSGGIVSSFWSVNPLPVLWRPFFSDLQTTFQPQKSWGHWSFRMSNSQSQNFVDSAVFWTFKSPQLQPSHNTSNSSWLLR